MALAGSLNLLANPPVALFTQAVLATRPTIVFAASRKMSRPRSEAGNGYYSPPDSFWSPPESWYLPVRSSKSLFGKV